MQVNNQDNSTIEWMNEWMNASCSPHHCPVLSCVCERACMCVSTCVACTYIICVCVYTHTCVYVSAFMVYVYMCTCVCVCVSDHACVWVHVWLVYALYACVCMHMCLCLHAHMCVYVCMHGLCIHVHVRACVCACLCSEQYHCLTAPGSQAWIQLSISPSAHSYWDKTSAVYIWLWHQVAPNQHGPCRVHLARRDSAGHQRPANSSVEVNRHSRMWGSRLPTAYRDSIPKTKLLSEKLKVLIQRLKKTDNSYEHQNL